MKIFTRHPDPWKGTDYEVEDIKPVAEHHTVYLQSKRSEIWELRVREEPDGSLVLTVNAWENGDRISGIFPHAPNTFEFFKEVH